MEKILISACLIGKNCKYNGKNNLNDKVMKFLEGKEYIFVCPECLGGLPTPRFSSELQDSAFNIISNEGKITNTNNENVTKQFLNGAYKSLDIALKNNVKLAILKAKSPSCGSNIIYDGSFSHKIINGDGVFAYLLKQHGIKVLTEEDL